MGGKVKGKEGWEERKAERAGESWRMGGEKEEP
jgi:hypothetical protein